MLHQDGAKAESQGCAQTRHCHLGAHGRSQLFSTKPFGDNFRNRDARDVASHAEESEAKRRDENLHFHLFGNEAKECESHICIVGWRYGCDGIIIDEASGKHASRGKDAREANATFVEDDTAEE